MYERVIKVAILAHKICSENYSVKLYFVKALNCKISLKKISRIKTLQY